MKSTEVLNLRLDIQKVIDTCNNEIDAYIGTFKGKNKEIRDRMQAIFEQKVNQRVELAKKMAAKYGRKD